MTRFREQAIGFVADVESMFHAFQVSQEHRDLMRFFWWEDNDPKKQVITYRARVHVFGNTFSPAVATTCLRKAAEGIEGKTEDLKTSPHYLSAQSYIVSHFYCDDGLGTAASAPDAIGVLSMAKNILARYEIRLHKIVSNSPEVLAAFSPSERAIESEVEFFNAPTHSTLGVAWNVLDDCFTLKVSLPERPFTRRGMLSVTNSIYDPIGFVCPVILGGKLIMRKVLSEVTLGSERRPDWDDPLESHQLQEWTNWLSSLQALHLLSIPRCFLLPEAGDVVLQTLHVFADASLDAIGNVCYLRSTNSEGEVNVAFVHGESKLAPRAATSIPRLELCAAVEAVSSSQHIINDLKRPVDGIYYYSDSRVVLAYIKNESKRFSRYVQRREDLIRHSSQPSEWTYLDIASNPADHASRPTEPGSLQRSMWLTGPPFLMTSPAPAPQNGTEPDSDFRALPEEESPVVCALQTKKSVNSAVSQRL
ncbi:uncharacterized protein LOC108679439 [Hyalella azteca]|uniref:Uncharacterized protein LOC108679439 n=1 Tax=Hyalella azteca TaxID=294128 RepID=A0A8B7PBT6_HYAAZ|nr:uncharacterized protein LOC108679439 [Hyalella azteca]